MAPTQTPETYSPYPTQTQGYNNQPQTNPYFNGQQPAAAPFGNQQQNQMGDSNTSWPATAPNQQPYLQQYPAQPNLYSQQPNPYSQQPVGYYGYQNPQQQVQNSYYNPEIYNPQINQPNIYQQSSDTDIKDLKPVDTFGGGGLDPNKMENGTNQLPIQQQAQLPPQQPKPEKINLAEPTKTTVPQNQGEERKENWLKNIFNRFRPQKTQLDEDSSKDEANNIVKVSGKLNLTKVGEAHNQEQALMALLSKENR